MKIAVLGSGYVGLVAAAGFADAGHQVQCIDIDTARVERLRRGEVPFFEPGLGEILARAIRGGRLTFGTEIDPAHRTSEVYFIAVGTPPQADGSADISAVHAAARTIRDVAEAPAVVGIKSTVPVGTCDAVQAIVDEGARHPLRVASVPEFLKEGSALADFMKPDRIILGVADAEAERVLRDLYRPLQLSSERVLVMDRRSSELSKYAANAMLATRISFMNELSRLCDAIGADVHAIRRAVGSDRRIGHQFLYAGPGFGGSCLAGHETVLVRQQGRTRLMSLRALFAQASGDAHDDPGMQAATLAEVEVMAWSPASETPQFFPASHVTRRPYEGPLHTVRTKMGRRIRCTADHPFVVFDGDGKPRGVKLARELGVDDWLPLAQGGDAVVQAVSRIDVLDAVGAGVEAPEVIVRLGPAGKAALEALGLDAISCGIAPKGHPRGRERTHDILRNAALRLDEARLLSLPLEDATFGTAKNGTYLPRFLEVNETFLRVIGLYLAEGHCTADGKRQRLTWSFHPTQEEELVQEVAGYWRDLGVKCAVRRATTGVQVSISSRLLASVFLRRLRLGKDCYEHRLPELSWSLSRRDKLALLSGLWQGDGSWSFLAGGPSVAFEYGTASPALADGMLRLLGDLGVCARHKIGRTAKSTVDTHWLVVSGADQLETLMPLVPESDRDPILASLKRQKKRISPTGYRRVREGVALVRVVDTTSVPFQGHVYSLEVPGAETFVTTGGLITHNCFPKDVSALVFRAREAGVPLEVVEAAGRANEAQRVYVRDRALSLLGGEIRGKVVAVWGVAFKAETDDVRETPALPLVRALVEGGAEVRIHDPEAAENFVRSYGLPVRRYDSEYEAAEGADLVVVMTEWRHLRNPDFERLRARMRTPNLFDARNIWTTFALEKAGFRYLGVGTRG
jgi:UDPglucose 6-dehydrogenase